MIQRMVVAALLVFTPNAAFSAPPANADPNSPMSQWYRGLKQPHTGISCCDMSDCRPTLAEYRDGEWWAARPDGELIPIPHERIIHDETHPAGRAVLCWTPAANVLCFVPPGAGI